MSPAAKFVNTGYVYWKSAGLSYLQYLNVAARATRTVLKEAPRLKAAIRQPMSYNKTVGSGAKVPITSAIPL